MHTTTQHEPRVTHNELKTRLDELRVKLHLGSKDAQEKYEALTREVAALGRKATRATKSAARVLLERIRALDASLISRD